MAPKSNGSPKLHINKGAWTAEEDQKLSQCIKIHGEKRWRLLPAKAGLNRSGKSCRLRWLNYLRPGIKRGDFCDQEEDLIIRLHKLLGNRWSLIAGRLPGRTDNEIKNYWNSHLSKRKKNHQEKQELEKSYKSKTLQKGHGEVNIKSPALEEHHHNCPASDFNVEELFDFEEVETERARTDHLGGPNEEKKTPIDQRFDGSVVVPTKGRLDLDWIKELLEFDDGVGTEEWHMSIVSSFS